MTTPRTVIHLTLRAMATSRGAMQRIQNAHKSLEVLGSTASPASARASGPNKGVTEMHTQRVRRPSLDAHTRRVMVIVRGATARSTQWKTLQISRCRSLRPHAKMGVWGLQVVGTTAGRTRRRPRWGGTATATATATATRRRVVLTQHESVR